jgi:DNA-binding transcriptional LysR family regulator
MVERTCRGLGGFEPDIRHRTADATVSLALVARGMAVTLLPGLILPERRPGIAVRRIAEGGLSRIFAATARRMRAARRRARCSRPSATRPAPSRASLPEG